VRKLMTLMLGLSFLVGTATMFAQATSTDKSADSSKKKSKKKKKSDKTDTEKKG